MVWEGFSMREVLWLQKKEEQLGLGLSVLVMVCGLALLIREN